MYNLNKISGLIFNKKKKSAESVDVFERERRIFLTSLTSIVYKVISSAIPLITLKVTYDYLGVEVYGLWNAVTNLFALFAFSDLGLGNGLQTKLSYASGCNDTLLCKQLVASTNLILWLVALILLAIFGLSFQSVDWAQVMNAKDSETIMLAAPIVFIIVLPKIFSIPVAIIMRTQYALQEGYNSNIWNIFGSLVSLISILVITKFDLGKLNLLWAASIIPLVISIINMIVYYGYQRKDLSLSLKWVNFKLARNLLKLGIYFCVIQLLSTIGLSMDTYIVAKTCSLSESSSFSILYKVSIVISSVIAIFSQPLWAANGEAIAKGDFKWVFDNTRKISLRMTVITLIGAFLYIVFSKSLFNLWISSDFQFSLYCVVWLCMMQVAMAFISPYFMILNAFGEIKLQIILFSLYTPLSLLLKVFLADYYGIDVIPFVGAILYLFIVLAVYIKSRNLLYNHL
ncbi:lipopolysaccharide biosynthesis protein [Bacteroides sp.]